MNYQDKLKLYDKLQDKLIDFRHNNYSIGEYGEANYDIDKIFRIIQEVFGFD